MSDYDYQENEVPQGRARGVRPLGALDRKRKLDEAVRLTADAVIEAADAWWNERWAYKRIDQKEDALREAVLAHRKAKAAQQEASRG